MPFSTCAGWLANIIAVPPHIQYECEDHPAVESWEIDVHGSLHMKRAGILASSTGSYAGELWMTIHIPVSENFDGHFSDLVSRLPKGECIYAVSLLGNLNFHHGIILQGPKTARLVKQRLVQIGIYYLRNRDRPPTSEVSWVVV